MEEIASDRIVKFAGVETQEANILTLGGVQRPVSEAVENLGLVEMRGLIEWHRDALFGKRVRVLGMTEEKFSPCVRVCRSCRSGWQYAELW